MFRSMSTEDLKNLLATSDDIDSLDEICGELVRRERAAEDKAERLGSEPIDPERAYWLALLG